MLIKNMKMKNNFKILILVFFLLTGCQSKKNESQNKSERVKQEEALVNKVSTRSLSGRNPLVFSGSPVYKVAKLIHENKNSILLVELNKLSISDLNYQDTNYKLTLGHFALLNRNMRAAELLLEKGINPNLIAKGGSSMVSYINSADLNDEPKSVEILKKIIDKGGNVNLLFSGKSGMYRSPLITASSSNLEKTKILISAGANPNFVYENTPGDQFPESPLIRALISSNIDIVNYLIFEADVDYKMKQHEKSKYNKGGYKILGYLRAMTFPLGSDNHKKKMRLVNYLKGKGLDYWSTPVPKYVKEFPGRSEEYLSKY